MTASTAIFLDVDGTLVGEDARVPASAIAAVREARARGHRVFLCTGRSRAELWPELWDIGFDGFIGASGAHVEADGVVLAHRTLPLPDLHHALSFFAEHSTPTYLQADDAVYASAHVRDLLVARIIASGVPADRIGHGPFAFLPATRPTDDPDAIGATKIIYIDCPVPLADLRRTFAGSFDVVPSSLESFGGGAGEMTAAGLHKAAGLDVLIDHLGIDRTETIAIGDSFNDLEMLAHAGVGIAMGGAPDAVRAAADESTGRVEDDGIAEAFRRHGLIA